MAVVSGGRTVYGVPVGIVMLDTRFPRLLGDVGNATTWPFPVAYRVVREALPERLAQPDPDPTLLEPFLCAVRALERDGVDAVITSCGFLAVYQHELASAVSIPVFSSPLLQVALAARTIRPDQCVAILTARPVLTERHFNGVGWTQDDLRVVQMAPPETSHFVRTFVGNRTEADPDLLRRDVAELAHELVAHHPDVGAIVLECANFPPFRDIVRQVTGRPVFDLYTLGLLAHLSTGAMAPSHRAMPNLRASSINPSF